MKKLFLFIICISVVFSSCGKAPEEKTDFYEPFSENFVYSEEFPESGPNGDYLCFSDFAVDFPAGWYKDRNGIVCQFTRSIKDVSVGETVFIKSAKSAFRKTDKEHSDAVYSEEMTFGGYPAKKYVAENPEGFDHYRKYIYEYYIAMDEKLIHLSFFPENTENLKNQREFFENSLDSITKMSTDFPESLYDMDIENFLSGKNDEYLWFLFENVISAFIEYESEGFSSASELSSKTLLNVYFSAAESHNAMYELKNETYSIPAKDILSVLDKYFENYKIDFDEASFGIKLSEDGKDLLSPKSLFHGYVPFGHTELESVTDNGDGSLAVKFISFDIGEKNGTFSSSGDILAKYSFSIRPEKNKCIIENLDIEYLS